MFKVFETPSPWADHLVSSVCVGHQWQNIGAAQLNQTWVGSDHIMGWGTHLCHINISGFCSFCYCPLKWAVIRGARGYNIYQILLWICLYLGFCNTCLGLGIFFCLWVGNSWFGIGLLSWPFGCRQLLVSFQPFWLCLQYFGSGFGLGVVNNLCTDHLYYCTNCTVQLDKTRHQSGLSFVNETSQILVYLTPWKIVAPCPRPFAS